jgi:predicted MPP superfamily phosphohydrolase
MTAPSTSQTLTPQITIEGSGSHLAFRGPRHFEWTSLRVPVPNLPRELTGFRFVHLSDIHARSYWCPAYDTLIARLKQSPPDLLLITGDFINDLNDHRPGLRTLKKLIPQLSSRLGTFAVLGNHDVDLVAPDLIEMKINLIGSRRVLLEEPGGAKVELIGLCGVDRRDLEPRFLPSLPPRQPQTLRIVLSHFPDHFRLIKPLQADFFLAGHTHGGQVCLPGGFPLITHDRMPKTYCKGIHRLDDTWYIVSRGLGYASIPIRVNCPAEVAEITTSQGANL